jgi:hypothetical protein
MPPGEVQPPNLRYSRQGPTREGPSQAGISPEILLKHTSEHVKLEFPDGYQLQCLQGHHRVLAASEVMPPHKRRWVVKLFSSGM